MGNSYAAVARTYPQRLFSGGLTAMWVIILPVMVVVPFLDQYDLRRTSLPVTLLMPGAFLIGILASHLKQVAIDAKSRLLPRSMRKVLLVAAGCAAAYLIGLPLLLNLRGGVPLLWSAALMWMWCAAVFHFVIRQSWPVTALLAVVYGLSFMQPSPLTTWLTVASYPPVAWLLLLASVVWVAIVTRWLLRMNEESPGYTALSSGQMALKAREVSTEQTNRPWQDPNRARWLRFNSPGQRQTDRVINCSSPANIFLRCRRWQVGGMQQYWPCVFTVAVMAPQFFMPRPSLVLAMTMSFGFAVSMAAQRLQQWQTLATGLLKPISREDYFRELGLCLAIDMARNLAIIVVVILAFTLLASPIDFRPALILPFLLTTALAAIFSFGAVVWLMRYRSRPALVIPIFVVMIPYVMLGLDSLIHIHWLHWLALCTATFLALLGLWLTRDAYRRWLLTDLG